MSCVTVVLDAGGRGPILPPRGWYVKKFLTDNKYTVSECKMRVIDCSDHLIAEASERPLWECVVGVDLLIKFKDAVVTKFKNGTINIRYNDMSIKAKPSLMHRATMHISAHYAHFPDNVYKCDMLFLNIKTFIKYLKETIYRPFNMIKFTYHNTDAHISLPGARIKRTLDNTNIIYYCKYSAAVINIIKQKNDIKIILNRRIHYTIARKCFDIVTPHNKFWDQIVATTKQGIFKVPEHAEFYKICNDLQCRAINDACELMLNIIEELKLK